MSNRSSHTYCQVAQADTQAKTWQRVCLPHPEKIELKNFPSPSGNKKYATAQPNVSQKSFAMQIPKPLTGKRFNYSVDRRPVCKTGLAKVAVQCSADTFVVNHSLVLRINICAKNPPLRQYPTRCKIFCPKERSQNIAFARKNKPLTKGKIDENAYEISVVESGRLKNLQRGGQTENLNLLKLRKAKIFCYDLAK